MGFDETSSKAMPPIFKATSIFSKVTSESLGLSGYRTFNYDYNNQPHKSS